MYSFNETQRLNDEVKKIYGASATDLVKSETFENELRKTLNAHGRSMADAAAAREAGCDAVTKMAVLNARIETAKRLGIIGNPPGPGRFGGNGNSIPLTQ